MCVCPQVQDDITKVEKLELFRPEKKSFYASVVNVILSTLSILCVCVHVYKHV